MDWMVFLTSALLVLPLEAQEPPATPSAPVLPGEEKEEEVGLTSEEEDAVEQELTHIEDPQHIERLFELARKLSQKRAFCRATKHLEAIEKMAGAITDNRAFAAQSFYLCARTRLSQGLVAESAMMLQRAINIVPERPEYRDLLFKLAVVRAKDAIDRADIDAVEDNLEEARKLGIALGPGGGGDRLADWAIPIMNETANEVAVWSQGLLDAKNRPLADRASNLALRFHPHNKIANSVRRDMFMFGAALPVFLAALGLLIVAAVIWNLVRRYRVKSLANDLEVDDLD
ncbi:hypothetical protein ACFL6C_08045 [Myxococcota bacterium]